MTFVQAERRSIPVVLSLSGKSGSGKTYSALIMAGGLVPKGGKICLIDTERGRGTMYADDPKVPPYFVTELHPPFTAQSFVDKMREAQEFGADCIIIDSASHEWSGQGGCLEQVDDLIAAKGERMRMPAWGRVKAAHRRFVNAVTSCSCHLILCMRAKDKMEEVTNPKTGKKEWHKLDQPVPEQQAEFVYEMTAAAMIDGEHQARWTKVPEPLKSVLSPGIINADQGSAIRTWVEGGSVVNQDAERHLTGLREASFERGREGMSAYWTANIKGKVDAVTLEQLKAHLPELERLASEADETKAQAERVAASQDEGSASTGDADPFADKFTQVDTA